MAKSTPETEFDLKKRLVGAFILIGFSMVVLPALLGGTDPRGGADETPAAAAPDPNIFVSKITPIGGDTPRPAGPDQLVDANPPEGSPVVPVQPKADKDEPSRADTTAKPTSATKPDAASKDEPGWVVRIGTFAKASNVERVVERLQQAGFEPSTTEIKSGQDTVIRVWIGPYAQRVEAARMRTRVEQVTGGEGYIAVYP